MRLLIVGNLNTHVTEAINIVKKQGVAVSHCTDVTSAVTFILQGKGADLVMISVELDIGLFVSQLTAEHVNTTVVSYGIEADSKAAVASIKAGAKEYIPLPPDEKLIAAVLEAIAQDQSDILYAADAMKKIIDMADRIAPSDANVLITGESGTGKEVLARYLHQKSKRNTGNFVSVNCAAIPDNLLESELFGHEKGAFTGALHRRIGKFEESNNGTLLLDEISEMDISLQAKLLRAIQEKEIDRVGGTQPIRLNLRVLATSNRNLKESVAKGEFREDLLFRLNIIELKIPPLRERKEDIDLFSQYFIEKYSESNGISLCPLSPEARALLHDYHWPGNVRELENTMHRAVLLNMEESIQPDALLLHDYTPSADFSTAQTMPTVADAATTSSADSPVATENNNANPLIGRTVESVEKDLILNTLDHCLGNRTHAANILGISIRTLRNKLKLYNESIENIT